MSKILKNPDLVNPVILVDTGVTVPANTNYTIPPQDYLVFAASSDVISALSDGLLILNDGGNDITNLSDAVDIIKGWCPGSQDSGQNFFFDYFNVPVGVGPHTLFTYTITYPTMLELSRLKVSCRMESIFQVLHNGTTIAALFTGAAQPTDSFVWYPSRDFAFGDLVEIILTKRTGAPDVSVGLNLQGLTRLTP